MRSRMFSAVAARLGAVALTTLGWADVAQAAPTTTEFTMPTGLTPTSIATRQDGTLWITTTSGKIVGATSLGPFTTLTPPSAVANASGLETIAAGPASTMWFTMPGANRIGRISSGNSITEFTVPNTQATPAGIALGPDGNLWFTEPTSAGGTPKIGRITTAGVITEFTIPGGVQPAMIKAGPDGAMWFGAANGATGRVDTSTGAITLTPSAEFGANGLFDIRSGPDDLLWATDLVTDLIRFPPAFAAANHILQAIHFTAPGALSKPTRLTVGHDGGIWFTEKQTDKIARITTDGTISEIPLAAGASPAGIAAGLDGAMWIVEAGLNRIARVLPRGSDAPFLAAAVLPSSRSVQVGGTANAFATLINGGSVTATACRINSMAEVPATFSFQTTNPATNALTGTANAPVDILPGAAQTFVIALTPTAAFQPTEVPFGFSCSNTNGAAITTGVNTLLTSASATQTSDLIALAATPTGDGILNLPNVPVSTAAFAVAVSNEGAAGPITVSADSIPGPTLTLCQTNTTTGACTSAIQSTVTTTIAAHGTATFGIFVQLQGSVTFLPDTNRIFVRFKDAGGATRGSTSVALRTVASSTPAGVTEFTTIDFDTPVVYVNPSLPAYYDATVQALDNIPAGNAITNRGAALGRVLFYDKRVSINDSISCSSCHKQALGFTDNARFSTGFSGAAFTTAHAMRIGNVRYYRPGSMFWDKRSASVEDQATQPIQNAVEMGWDASHGGMTALIAKLQATSYYPDLFNWAFGSSTITEARIQQAIAQFERAMISSVSKWDTGYAQVFNPNAPNRALGADLPNFTAQENRGRALFMAAPNAPGGGAGCSACHVPPTFGLAANSNSNGLDAGETRLFKSPALKNLGVTGPYMHDGRFSTLEEVVEFYDHGIQAGPALDNRLRGPQGQGVLQLNLSTQDKVALVAFLRTLDDPTLNTDTRFSSPMKK